MGDQKLAQWGARPWPALASRNTCPASGFTAIVFGAGLGGGEEEVAELLATEGAARGLAGGNLHSGQQAAGGIEAAHLAGSPDRHPEAVAGVDREAVGETVVDPDERARAGSRVSTRSS